MNVRQANTSIAQAQRILDHVLGKNKSESNAIERVRSLLESANRDLQPDDAAPVALPTNDGTSAAQTRRKERFW